MAVVTRQTAQTSRWLDDAGFRTPEMSLAGLIVDEKPGLSRAELLKIMPDYDGLIVRSATRVTADSIDACAISIGRALAVDHLQRQRGRRRSSCSNIE